MATAAVGRRWFTVIRFPPAQLAVADRFVAGRSTVGSMIGHSAAPAGTVAIIGLRLLSRVGAANAICGDFLVL